MTTDTLTYWYLQPRDFGNEYNVGVADTEADVDQYDIEGYRRIERDEALALMSRRASDGESLFVDVQLNGRTVSDRFLFARAIRAGRDYSEFV